MPRMTPELLCKCTGQAKRKKDETAEQFLRRITHLYCAEKGIETIECLGSCRSLTVLYLYDNFVSHIDGLSPCTALTHLYLQNNHISRIESLGPLHRLTKLYLGGNAVTVVEGLEGLTQLSELHIAGQRLPEGEKLLFDPRSLQAIAPSLKVLNVSGNGLDSMDDLQCLSQLTHLSATDNELTNMKELSHVLSRWPRLDRLELSGNPLCLKYKYRDRAITMCHHLGMLDGREVSEMERQFLMSWKAMRRARRRQHRQARLEEYPSHAIPTAKQIFSSLPAPLTMPALPARQPLRADGRRRHVLLHEHHGEERTDNEQQVRLPEIVRQSQAPPVTHQRLPFKALSPLKEMHSSWRTSYGFTAEGVLDTTV